MLKEIKEMKEVEEKEVELYLKVREVIEADEDQNTK